MLSIKENQCFAAFVANCPRDSHFVIYCYLPLSFIVHVPHGLQTEKHIRGAKIRHVETDAKQFFAVNQISAKKTTT